MPATRSDVFASEGLSFHDRRVLTRFFAFAQAALDGASPQKVICTALVSRSFHLQQYLASVYAVALQCRSNPKTGAAGCL